MHTETATDSATDGSAAVTVLVADDHGLLREGLTALLTRHGVNVVGEACDGLEAVAASRRLRPGVIVMDVAMPKLNGIEATRQVLEQRPEAKVVAVSVRTDPAVVGEALSAGAGGFVPKCAAFEELAVALAAVGRGETYISPKVAGPLVKHLDGDGEAGAGTGRAITGRERRVLQLVAEGQAMKQIAVTLGISVKTVETHRRQVMDKLDLHSVAELTKYAVRHAITPA